jgi:hypothetical protein
MADETPVGPPEADRNEGPGSGYVPRSVVVGVPIVASGQST